MFFQFFRAACHLCIYLTIYFCTNLIPHLHRMCHIIGDSISYQQREPRSSTLQKPCNRVYRSPSPKVESGSSDEDDPICVAGGKSSPIRYGSSRIRSYGGKGDSMYVFLSSFCSYQSFLLSLWTGVLMLSSKLHVRHHQSFQNLLRTRRPFQPRLAGLEPEESSRMMALPKKMVNTAANSVCLTCWKGSGQTPLRPQGTRL